MLSTDILFILMHFSSSYKVFEGLCKCQTFCVDFFKGASKEQYDVDCTITVQSLRIFISSFFLI